MSFWFIAIPIVFGVFVAASIIACLCCRCTPQKAEDEEARRPQVLRVILYPNENGTNSNVNSPNHTHHQNSSSEARNGAANSNKTSTAAANARRHLEYRYYPLQIGEQRPITAAVAGSSASVRGQDPYVGTVVTDAGNSVPGDFSHVREPVNYGEAVYVSRSESSVTPVTKCLGNASE